jgi:cell volume regulation protein A
MISINLVFIFLASIAFLGFIFHALFNRIRITSVLPLMLIGLLFGPILKLIPVGPSSVVAELTPLITAVAISFILFDVGLNINFSRLARVLARATAFSVSVAMVSALLVSVAVYFVFHWSILEAMIFGLAISSTGSVIIPTIVKSANMLENLKTTLLYESISMDIFSLMVPLVLFGFITTQSITISGAVGQLFYTVFGSVILGVIVSFFWLYMLGSFKGDIKGYTWMLTITMVVATYAVAQQLGMSGAITAFVFGLLLANISSLTRDKKHRLMHRHFVVALGITNHIKSYQKEIVFFVSTFFFVYIGTLFNLSEASVALIGVAALLTALIFFVRYLFVPLLGGYMSENKKARAVERHIVEFSMPRGTSPAVIATVPIALGILIPNFINQLFLIILFTNIISAIGILITYKPEELPKSERPM